MKKPILCIAAAILIPIAIHHSITGCKSTSNGPAGPGTATGTSTGTLSGTGLASKYIGDAGIENDSAVIFVEDFEAGSLSAVTARYDEVVGESFMSLSDDLPAGSAGNHSLLWTHRQDEGDASHLYTTLLPGYDKLYLRYYVKFDTDCGPIHHWIWLGGLNPPTRWPNPQAGVKPDGDDRFSTGVETMGDSWRWDYYTYWMEMRGNAGPRFYGNLFINDDTFTVSKNEWICVEFMVKMNDPGEQNGEQAMWINGRERYRDGQKISHLGPGFPNGSFPHNYDKWIPDPSGDPFEGFRWRTTTDLNINYLWLELYITDAPQAHVSRVWIDHVVVATEYIGPMRTE